MFSWPVAPLIKPKEALAMNQNPFQQPDRPVALIFISLFVFIMAGFSMMSVISAILRATSTSTEEQQMYVSSLTFIDYGLVLLANLALFIGGAALFLARTRSSSTRLYINMMRSAGWSRRRV